MQVLDHCRIGLCPSVKLQELVQHFMWPAACAVLRTHHCSVSVRTLRNLTPLVQKRCSCPARST